ncbi:MAG: hypothetical protein D6696_02705 [Acidobacteria bacterium]|nr:MAG: hypothetical protein D6696_02705 [Acidobacteriota bacterium]
MNGKLSSALSAEFIGTFTLIFIGAGAGAIGAGGLVGVAFAHGLVVLGAAYCFGAVSGAHVNPAVTVALWVAKEIDAARALAYVVVQLVAGVAGAFCLAFVLRGSEWADSGLGATVLAPGVTPFQGLVLEAILTFFLASAVLNAAVSGRGGQHAGLAIGLTLTFAILMGGPLTGASLNPARTLGPAVAGGNFADVWLYFAGPVLGGVVAAVLYGLLFKKSE